MIEHATDEIRAATESDLQNILELNEAEVQQTSPLELDQLRSLVSMSAYCKVAIVQKRVQAFLIALREEAPYENENYKWFASRFSSFLYVDRIVVRSPFRGRKIGSELYEDLFSFAQSQGISTIACEYNIDPPNPASCAFHNKFGFKQLGTQWVAGGRKQVSLQVANA
jgi:predicted GNAT superfamily acetyltransferase